MKFLTLFSLLMVTLLARNRKHYLVEVEDKNEIIDENEENLNNKVENSLNHEDKNVKPRKVFTLKYFITNIMIYK